MAATEREYLITVSAVLGRSTAASLGDWVKQAQQAKAQVETILNAPSKGAAKAAKSEAEARVSEQKKAQAELERIRERENNQILRDVEKRARFEERQAERAAKQVAAIKERYFREEQRRGEQADAQRQQRNEKIVSGAMSNMRRAAAVGARVAGELTAGFGVSFDLSAAMQRGAGLEKMAVDLVNAGNRGTGSAASRDAQAVDLQKQARGIGDKYRLDPSKVIAGLGQFQAKTGDLDTGTAGLDRFAKLAKAFNVDLDYMISAAGEISSKLPDAFAPGEQRAQKTYEVLKLLTAQGQEGAIEIADLAKETARIGGGAGFFKGDIGDTIGKLSGLAQLARQTGGANSAADAARAVSAFVTTLKTPARRAKFKQYGVDFEDSEGGFLDPNEIIKNALKATGGDVEKMNEMFKSSLGTKPVDALAKTYREAGKGEAGLAAIDEMLKKFSRPVSEDVIKENAARALETREAKAQAFQNKLDTIADSLSSRVLPAFEKMAPVALSVTEGLASIVTWAASHPFAAIGVAIAGSIAASIAKAAIGDAIGKAVAGGIGGKGLAIGAITATVAMAYLAIREYNEEKQKAGEEEKAKGEATEDLLKRAKGQLSSTGKIDADTMSEIIRRRAELEGARGRASRYDANEDIGSFEKLGAKIASVFMEGDAAKELAQYEGGGAQNAKDKATLDKQAASFDALLEAVRGMPKKGEVSHVIIDNLPGGAPGADPSGRVPQ